MTRLSLMKCPYCNKEIVSTHVEAKVYHLACAMEMAREIRERLAPIAEWMKKYGIKK